MTTLVANDKDKFLLNMEGQDFSYEAKTFIKLRERAFERLRDQDFPTPKQEDWKYTSVKDLVKTTLRPQSAVNVKTEDLKPFVIPGLNGVQLVFVNGFFQEKLSTTAGDLPEGLTVANMNEAKKEYLSLVESHLDSLCSKENLFFSNVNTAYAQDGGFVHVAKNANIELPIHLLFLTQGDEVSSQPRNLIVAEKNSKVSVITSYQTLDSESSLTNAVAEVFVADGAHVELTKIQNEHSKAINISFERAKVGKNATFTLNTVPVNGKLIRNNVKLELAGQGSTGNLYGAICLKGDSHVDNQTFVDHAVPHCESNEFYKSVVGDTATNIFNGKILVRKDAQKTNAFQSNANILMTDTAKANAKPQLEIYADDVKCSHGCTIGQFDDEALFYLRARGIKESTAKKVLLEAFLGEVTEFQSNEALCTYVEKLIHQNFKG